MLSNNLYNKIAQFQKINKIKLSLLKLLKIRPRLSKRNNHRLFAIRKLTDSNLQQLSKRTKPKYQHRLKRSRKYTTKWNWITTIIAAVSKEVLQWAIHVLETQESKVVWPSVLLVIKHTAKYGVVNLLTSYIRKVND